jgi:hypothetical protein
MEFEKTRSYILDRIGKELPSFLYYHSYAHVQDVYEAAKSWLASKNAYSFSSYFG